MKPHPYRQTTTSRPPAGTSRSHRAEEDRIYGLNACLALFTQRPQDLRKVYLVETRIPPLKEVLSWCVKQRLGYRVVADSDLEKLTQSRHHEGVCFEVRKTEPLSLSALIAKQSPAPAASLLLWLDGVGNPHNFGAVLRSAAHFAVDGVILPASSTLSCTGAAARVAEGGAEAVSMAQLHAHEDPLSLLHAAGYLMAATVPRAGESLYATRLPSRLVVVFGAESEGVNESLIAAADLHLTIPGSGVVESLNIAASVSVVLSEFWRQHRMKISAS